MAVLLIARGRWRHRLSSTAGGGAFVVTGDLTDDAAIVQIINDGERLLGGVDILVNDAGGSGEKHVWARIASAMTRHLPSARSGDGRKPPSA